MKIFLLLSLVVMAVECEETVESTIFGQFMGDAFFAMGNTILSQRTGTEKSDMLRTILKQNGVNIATATKDIGNSALLLANNTESLWKQDVEKMKTKHPELSVSIVEAGKKIHDGEKVDDSALPKQIIDRMVKDMEKLHYYETVGNVLSALADALCASTAALV